MWGIRRGSRWRVGFTRTHVLALAISALVASFVLSTRANRSFSNVSHLAIHEAASSSLREVCVHPLDCAFFGGERLAVAGTLRFGSSLFPELNIHATANLDWELLCSQTYQDGAPHKRRILIQELLAASFAVCSDWRATVVATLRRQFSLVEPCDTSS